MGLLSLVVPSWAKVAGIAVVGLVITGAISYGLWTLHTYDQKIVELTNQKAQLTLNLQQAVADKNKAIDANKTLQGALIRQAAELETERKERTAIVENNAISHDFLQKYSALLFDSQNADRELAIVHSVRGQLLLNGYNANVLCELQNFGKTDGFCVGGAWRTQPHGLRKARR